MSDTINTAENLNILNINGYRFVCIDTDARENISEIISAIQLNNSAISTRINDLNTRLTASENEINPSVLKQFEDSANTKYLLTGESMTYDSELAQYKSAENYHSNTNWVLNNNSDQVTVYNNYFKSGFNNVINIIVPNNLSINALKIYSMEDYDLNNFSVTNNDVTYQTYEDGNNILYYFNSNISGKTITISTGSQNYCVQFEFGQIDSMGGSINSRVNQLNSKLSNLETLIDTLNDQITEINNHLLEMIII
jgi:hypothetical protein